ncbi:MAG: tRNA (5-methylaminomethyl-2-thiouridine)(34)-methyltransferase MnmD [Paracoccaceae bacterium]
MTDQTAKLEWRDDFTPVSVRFDDPYFSLSDGLAECQHVFLAGNNLPDRFRPGFHIAELGFGTGLNMLASWMYWNNSGLPGPLHFTSFEQYPMSLEDMKTALAGFSELGKLAKLFLANWPDANGKIVLPGLCLHVITGDARKMLPIWSNQADAWFLDGFSPVKNPELWTPQLMADVADHTTSNGTFATYSAAGHIRRSLGQAGFAVNRVPGFGKKRHMSVGTKASIS